MDQPKKRVAKYRYRETTGVTERALAALQHLPKCGAITKVLGYQYRHWMKRSDGTWFTRVDHRVKVVGTTGEMLFWGFGYGYGGEGPHGLLKLFDAIGIPTGCMTVGEHVAFNIKMADATVMLGQQHLDWTIEPVQDEWKLTYPTQPDHGC
jgi:hypothetical protein